jgi:transposase InsO family protein
LVDTSTLEQEVFACRRIVPRTRRSSGVRWWSWCGRTPDELSREFEPSAEAIRQWVKQADRDDGRRGNGLTSAERDELYRLRRENRRLRQEAEGVLVGRKRIARLMRSAGLAGVSRRRRPRTTVREPSTRPAPDLVQRRFAAAGPDQLWVADISYVPTLAGFLYLAVVLDAFSRRIIGWAMASHLRTELVLDALEMAIAQRKPDNVIHLELQAAMNRYLAEHTRRPGPSTGPALTTPSSNALPQSLHLLSEQCTRLVRARRAVGNGTHTRESTSLTMPTILAALLPPSAPAHS